MVAELKLSMKKIRILWIIPSLGLVTIGLLSIILPATSYAQDLPLASCSIMGVPKTVTVGLGVTPTIVVTNNGTTTLVSTINVTESLINHGSGKGGGDQQTVTVPSGQSVGFQSGTLIAQKGYRIKIVAKSTSSPLYSCKAKVRVTRS